MLTEEKDVIVAPEGHHDAGRLIQGDRLDVLQRSKLPHAYLPIAHPAKSRRSDTIAVTHPDHTRAFDSTMALSDAYGIRACAGIEQAQFAIAGGCREELSRRIKRKTLDAVTVALEYSTWRFWRAQVPQFHGVVAHSAREDMLRSRVPEHLAYFSRRCVDVQYGREIYGRPAIRVPPFESTGIDLPYEHVTIFAAGRDDRV